MPRPSLALTTVRTTGPPTAALKGVARGPRPPRAPMLVLRGKKSTKSPRTEAAPWLARRGAAGTRPGAAEGGGGEGATRCRRDPRAQVAARAPAPPDRRPHNRARFVRGGRGKKAPGSGRSRAAQEAAAGTASDGPRRKRGAFAARDGEAGRPGGHRGEDPPSPPGPREQSGPRRVRQRRDGARLPGWPSAASRRPPDAPAPHLAG